MHGQEAALGRRGIVLASWLIAHEFPCLQLSPVAVDEPPLQDDEGLAEDMLMGQRAGTGREADEIEAAILRFVEVQRQPGEPRNRLAVAVMGSEIPLAHLQDAALGL